MKIWKKLLQVDRVHLDLIGNASCYIHKRYDYAIAFIVYSKLLVRMVIKFRKKKKKGGHF